MRKFLAAGILAVFSLFLPSKSHAVPLDVPYGNVTLSGTGGGEIVISSSSLPNSAYRWCLTHVVVSAPVNSAFTIWYSSTSTLTPSTTNYIVYTSSGVPYDTQWAYRTPYCVPAGDTLGMTESVSGSTVTFEGYSSGGWSNP